MDLPTEVIIRQYVAEKMSLREIGRCHGVSLETIRGRLLDAGVTLRAPSPRAEVEAEDIVALRKDGLAYAEIAERLGVSAQTVYRRLSGGY